MMKLNIFLILFVLTGMIVNASAQVDVDALEKRLSNQGKKGEHFYDNQVLKKEEIKENWKSFKELDASRREAIRQKQKEWESLPEEERKQLRKKWSRIKNMTPSQREEFESKQKRWQQMTPQDRQQYRQLHHSGNK